MTTKGHLVAVAAETHGSQRQDSATIGWRTITGGVDDQLAKSVGEEGIDGDMDAVTEGESTVGTGVEVVQVGT
jgi:hypothetical protein